MKNNVYDEMNPKELQEFFEQLTTEQFAKNSRFFDTMPKLRHTVKVKILILVLMNETLLEGMQSFLGYSFHMIVWEVITRVNFNMMQHYKYSLTELDNMIPWEREIYVGMLEQYIKEEKEQNDREKENQGEDK